MNFLVARAGAHMWEEPVISGTNGSGTIFFGSCNLRCIYCQNHEISHKASGLRLSENQLISLMLSLQDSGVHNINLVTPSHYAAALVPVLEKAKKRLKIPIVYNSSGYDKLADLQRLDGLIDVYLPDLKYADDEIALSFSRKPDYFKLASEAVKEMRRQQPCDCFVNYSAAKIAVNVSLNESKQSQSTVLAQALTDKKEGVKLIKRGVIVRHLVLPNHTENSIKVLDFLAQLDRRLYISVMAQYFPTDAVTTHPELNRRITAAEYDAVKAHFFKKGFRHGFMQDLESGIKDYVPSFDLETLKQVVESAARFTE